MSNENENENEINLPAHDNNGADNNNGDKINANGDSFHDDLRAAEAQRWQERREEERHEIMCAKRDDAERWEGDKLPMNTATLVCYARAMWAKKVIDAEVGASWQERNTKGNVPTHLLHNSQCGTLDQIAILLLEARAFPEGIEQAFAKLPAGSEAVFAMRQHFAIHALLQDITPQPEHIVPRNKFFTPRMDKVQIVQLGAGLDPLAYMLHGSQSVDPEATYINHEVFVVDQPDMLDLRRRVMKHASYMFASRGRHDLQRILDEQEVVGGVNSLGEPCGPRHIPMTFGASAKRVGYNSGLSDASELIHKLQRAGWSSHRPTMFVAMGLTYYLNEGAIQDILRMVHLINEMRPKHMAGSNHLSNSLILDYAMPVSHNKRTTHGLNASESIEQAEEALKDMGEPIDFKTDDMTPLLHHHGAFMVRETSFLSYYTMVMREVAAITLDDPRRLRFVEAAWQAPQTARHVGKLF
jgi:hypothetical protein